MTENLCRHVIDGKEVYFPKDRCPICNPQTSPSVTKTVNVYRKGGTIVIKGQKDTISTVTWWKDGEKFLVSVKHLDRDENGRITMGEDGKPLWNQQTIRLTLEQVKELLKLWSEMVTEIEVGRNVPSRG